MVAEPRSAAPAYTLKQWVDFAVADEDDKKETFGRSKAVKTRHPVDRTAVPEQDTHTRLGLLMLTHLCHKFLGAPAASASC